MTPEAKDQLSKTASSLPETERKFFELPRYKRKGLIPGWAEVVSQYQLSDLNPRDLRVLRGYYHAQRKIAEGSTQRASRIFRGLDHNPDFQNLEERQGILLHNIASFVRGQTERQRTQAPII